MPDLSALTYLQGDKVLVQRNGNTKWEEGTVVESQLGVDHITILFADNKRGFYSQNSAKVKHAPKKVFMITQKR